MNLPTDPPNNSPAHTSMGVQAYRWLVTGIMTLLVALSARVLSSVDKTAEKVDMLQLQVTEMRSSLESRLNAHVQRLDTIDRRNDTQDVKIDDLQRRVWRWPETRTTP
jgi:hypothetical protein